MGVKGGRGERGVPSPLKGPCPVQRGSELAAGPGATSHGVGRSGPGAELPLVYPPLPLNCALSIGAWLKSLAPFPSQSES